MSINRGPAPLEPNTEYMYGRGPQNVNVVTKETETSKDQKFGDEIFIAYVLQRLWLVYYSRCCHKKGDGEEWGRKILSEHRNFGSR